MQLAQDILTQLATALEIGMMLWFAVAFPIFVLRYPRHKTTIYSSAPARTPPSTTTAIKSESWEAAAKAVSATQTQTIAVPFDAVTQSTTLPNAYRLRGEDVVYVDELSFQLPSGFKTYQLRGKNVVRVNDLQGAKLST